MPITLHSPNGFTVLVGKHKRENERLTFREAAAHDFWFHAVGAKGAHVILRWNAKMPDSREPEVVDFQFAANAAAYHSDARTEKNAVVAMSVVCDVEKPKHSPVGTAISHMPRYMLVGKAHENLIRSKRNICFVHMC